MVIYSCLWICNTAADWAGESLIIRPGSLHIIATSASAGGSRKKTYFWNPIWLSACLAMIDTLLQVPALAGATTYHLITAG